MKELETIELPVFEVIIGIGGVTECYIAHANSPYEAMDRA